MFLQIQTLLLHQYSINFNNVSYLQWRPNTSPSVTVYTKDAVKNVIVYSRVEASLKPNKVPLKLIKQIDRYQLNIIIITFGICLFFSYKDIFFVKNRNKLNKNEIIGVLGHVCAQVG